MIVVGLAAGVLSSIRTPLYKATARVLLTPNDPTEQLNPGNGNGGVNNPDRYVTGQRNVVESEGVARQAADSLGDISVTEVESRLSVHQGSESDVLEISATSPDAAQAQDIANAVAKGYIENRRLAAVAGLQQAAKDIEDRLGPLQATIAELDTRIGQGSTLPGGTSALVSPIPAGSDGGSPTPAAAQVEATAAPEGPASTAEALKAARYAAAVQFETLYSRQQELLVDISLKRGEAELIAEAKAPAAPFSPHPKRDAALGVFVGLLLGVGITLLREQLDDRVRSAAEIETLTGLPMLTQLPFDEELAKNPNSLAVVDRPLGSLSETMRSLRTSVGYLGIDKPIRSIVVTSAAPGEGKSLVAANLAAVFAQAGCRTILISADLRRSRVETLFGKLPASKGLTGVLVSLSSTVASTHQNGADSRILLGSPGSNGTEPADALVETGVPSLTLLPSGAIPPNPAELLGSSRMAALLAKYASIADVIVIDTPPLLAVTDAAVLASKADGVILVTAINETHRDGLRRAKAILEGTGARILGTVVNKMTKSQGYFNYDSKYYGAYTADPKRGGGPGRNGSTESGADVLGESVTPDGELTERADSRRRRRSARRRAAAV